MRSIVLPPIWEFVLSIPLPTFVLKGHDMDPECCRPRTPYMGTHSRFAENPITVVTFKDGHKHEFANINFDANRMEDGFLTMETHNGDAIYHVIDALYWEVVYR